jgi:hypothetical protein
MAAKKQKFTIGRERTCDISIADPTVSARHAEISYLPDGRLLLTDCKSRNGTFRLLQDGTEHPVRQDLVSPYDRIRFGDVRLGVRELLESLRLKYPGFDGGAGRQSPAPDSSGTDLERCDCGAVKPLGKTCAVCGR